MVRGHPPSSRRAALILLFRACYVAIPLYLCGFLALGGSIQHHLNIGGLIMGWGIAETAIMINTVAIYAYANDCFPKHQVRILAKCPTKCW